MEDFNLFADDEFSEEFDALIQKAWGYGLLTKGGMTLPKRGFANPICQRTRT
jgi:hypothetical protein